MFAFGGKKMSYRNERRGIPSGSANRVPLGMRRHSYHVGSHNSPAPAPLLSLPPPAKHPRLDPAASRAPSSANEREDPGYDYPGKTAEKMFPDVSKLKLRGAVGAVCYVSPLRYM